MTLKEVQDEMESRIGSSFDWEDRISREDLFNWLLEVVRFLNSAERVIVIKEGSQE